MKEELPEHEYQFNKDKLDMSYQELDKLRKNTIKFLEPIISIGDIQMIFPKTTNLIQGQTGTHKSRLIEHMISALLKNGNTETSLGLKFHIGEKKPFIVLLDTEREKDVFAKAVQNILSQAGLNWSADITNQFYFNSLIDIKRADRIQIIKKLIEQLVKQYPSKHLIIFLDVLTDFITSFNNASESLLILDLINKTRNKYDVTFINVMHENPLNPNTARKAKGHLGTLLSEKASTTISLSKKKINDDYVKIEFIKTRRTKIPKPIIAKYDEQSEQLVPVTELEKRDLKRLVASSSEVARELINNINGKGKISQGVIIERLIQIFNCSVRSIRERLSEIEKGNIIQDFGYDLIISFEGKKKFYELMNLETNMAM